MEEKETKKKPAAKKPAAKASAKPASKTTAKPAAAKSAAAKPSAAKSAVKKPAPEVTPKEEFRPVAAPDEEEDDEIISLENDKGETVDFYHIATIDYENNWYVFFQPVDKTEDIDQDEVVVFKLDEDESGNDVFLPVESEELLHKVYAEYVRLIEDGGSCGGGGCDGCSGCK